MLLAMPRIDIARFLALTASLGAACAGGNPAPAPAPIVASAPTEVEVPDAAASDEPAPDAALAGPSAETESAPVAEDAVASDYIEGPSAEEYGGIGSLFAPGGAGIGTGRLGGAGFIGSTPDAGAPGAGALDPALIQRVMRAQVKKVKACYEAELARDPSFETKLTARFVIGTSGAVETVSLTTASGKPSLDTCVIGALKRLRFPAPKGGKVTVSYPFVFKSV